MARSSKFGGNRPETPDDKSRREFMMLSAAAGLAAATASVRASAPESESLVSAHEVQIKTPDGTCDAAFFHPDGHRQGRSFPGVLIWPDAVGLRPVMRDMGKRLAAAGYAVLVPNPFYRSGPAPLYTDPGSFDFKDAAQMEKLMGHMGPLNAPGAAEHDALAYIAFLDAQSQVNKAKKLGTQGYCMGGPLIMKTAAVAPERVGAAASFHGGRLVTDKPDSPHLLAPKIKARMYFGVAASDDDRQPDVKDKLRAALADAHVTAEIEVYPGTIHGWCMADMPLQEGKVTYSKPDAERAWGKLLALYKAGIA